MTEKLQLILGEGFFLRKHSFGNDNNKKKSEMTTKEKKKEKRKKINAPPLSFCRHPEEKHIFSLGLSAYTVRAV